TKMRPALLAHDFSPTHAVRPIVFRFDGIGRERLEEAWPARSGLELGVGIEQRLAASGALVHPLVVIVDIGAGERALSALLAHHLVLLRRQLLPPLGVGLFDGSLSVHCELLSVARGRW